MPVAQGLAVRWVFVSVVCLLGCSEQRAPPPPGGEHPGGWTDPSSPAFHGKWLAANGFPLPECQQCHGDDYAGGAVGVSCSQSGCHAQAPIACTTCHGSNGSPRPSAGAHGAHEAYCSTCHQVPAETTASVERHASGDASTLVRFSGVAVPDAGADAAPPEWNQAPQRCTNTYCHGAVSPVWTSPTPIGCGGCHGAPPADHAKWQRVAGTTAQCKDCHPDPSGPTHIDGVLEVTVTSCTACHGTADHAYPPLSLGGATDPSTPGVGAHVRHLDGTLADRISEPLPCNDCHVEPSSVTQPGHLDAPETVVRFPFGGSYDAGATTCTVWCHFDRSPGPVWTDDSGRYRQCNACHDFPPTTTRAGDPHPSVPGELSACLRCHPFSPATHVNGVVDFLQQP
jgi:predicted CxxxxCH...CXXCH cytochrome family protein